MTTGKETMKTAIPDEAVTMVAPLIALRDYPDYEEDPDFTRKVLEVASPVIRAQFLNDCVNEFLGYAAETGMPPNVAEGIAVVFRAFAQQEEDRGRRNDEAHGRTT